MNSAQAIAACGHVGTSGPSVMPCAMVVKRRAIEHVIVQKELMRKNVAARVSQLSPKHATKSAAKTVSSKSRSQFLTLSGTSKF